MTPKINSVKQHPRSGQLALQVLIIGAVSIVLIGGFVVWTDQYVRSTVREGDRTQAFAVAESGIEYYRWHLAHVPEDFKDGMSATSTGPFVHPYLDKNGNRIGQFSLDITPPATGTTMVVVTSTGTVDSNPTVKKIIRSKLAVPFIGQYAVLTNGNIEFSSGAQVYGLVHSNGGVRFDGVANNTVTSARTTYDDPAHSGANEFGVHTHAAPADPLPPAAVPIRNDVFKGGRNFPVPAIDFTSFGRALTTIKTEAKQAGYYKTKSGVKGYDVVLKTNDTFDLYKVTALTKISKDCKGATKRSGTWTIKSETLLASNIAFPVNNLMFFEDDVWVRGQINTARLTIANGRFPARKNKYANIIVTNDLKYTNFDGQDVLGLIAQGDFKIGFESEDDLIIDAALVAQNGKASKDHYSAKCGAAYVRSNLSLYGMIATNNNYGFAYTDGTGYQNRTITYDANLLYSPPPNFPTIGNQYEVISWEEVR